MKDDKLVAQAAIFFSAGFESSSSLMSFTLYELCFNREIQSRLRNEIKSVLAKNNGELTYETLQEMNYLDMVCAGMNFILYNSYCIFKRIKINIHITTL